MQMCMCPCWQNVDVCVCPSSAELQCVCFCWQSVNVCVCPCWQNVNVCVSLSAELQCVCVSLLVECECVCVLVGRMLMCVCPLSTELQCVCVCLCWQNVNEAFGSFLAVGWMVMRCMCPCWQIINRVSLLAKCELHLFSGRVSSWAECEWSAYVLGRMLLSECVCLQNKWHIPQWSVCLCLQGKWHILSEMSVFAGQVAYPQWGVCVCRASGKLDIPHTVPDTITQWVGNSMCISDSAGFGLSPITSITTFQPFFLSFNLPYNAVRGERLPITITVYNYLDKCLHVGSGYHCMLSSATALLVMWSECSLPPDIQ